MRTARELVVVEPSADNERALRGARIGQRVMADKKTQVTVLQTPPSYRACFQCVFFPEFGRSEAFRCKAFHLCNSKDRPDHKSVYFRIYNEK